MVYITLLFILPTEILCTGKRSPLSKLTFESVLTSPLLDSKSLRADTGWLFSIFLVIMIQQQSMLLVLAVLICFLFAMQIVMVSSQPIHLSPYPIQ